MSAHRVGARPARAQASVGAVRFNVQLTFFIRRHDGPSSSNAKLSPLLAFCRGWRDVTHSRSAERASGGLSDAVSLELSSITDQWLRRSKLPDNLGRDRVTFED
ncbi:hypothetical protein EVAR_41231_1 [Eumeta japonica]|uniref:Uncharacterized protein n=1 Tax=Eumeta variegata TaxID=151549 RepID=A0A4C1W4V1_EUMVA|nr:hypothetical protein EVAR_41231_1 [Eumeta japonica]